MQNIADFSARPAKCTDARKACDFSDAGIFCRQEKNDREKMKVMQKYRAGKLTLKLCFVFFGLSIHDYCLL